MLGSILDVGMDAMAFNADGVNQEGGQTEGHLNLGFRRRRRRGLGVFASHLAPFSLEACESTWAAGLTGRSGRRFGFEDGLCFCLFRLYFGELVHDIKVLGLEYESVQ